MSAELETPTDRITGFPLTVKVTPEQLSLKGRNHHPNHPNKRPDLANSIGRALRYSRVYWMPDVMHMGNRPGSYHDIFWGPWMDKELNDETKHRMAVLNLAGVALREAIVLDGNGSYEVVGLTDKEHLFMASDQITTLIDGNGHKKQDIRKNLIGHAFVEYALEQESIDLLSGKQQERFLSVYSEATIMELGSLMIHRAVEESLGYIQPTYQEAKDAGMVNEPVDLKSLIKELLPEHEFGQYQELIRNKILANRELAAAA